MPVPQKPTALKKVLAPAYSTGLTMRDGSKKQFKLAFDFNAWVAVQEKSGLRFTDGPKFWEHYMEPVWLRVVLWAATLLHHAEYAGADGLDTIGSYIWEGNMREVLDAIDGAYLLSLTDQDRNNLLEVRAARKKKESEEDPPDEGDVPLEKAPASSSSGPSPDTILSSATASS
jgi:hypothetical protein